MNKNKGVTPPRALREQDLMNSALEHLHLSSYSIKKKSKYFKRNLTLVPVSAKELFNNRYIEDEHFSNLKKYIKMISDRVGKIISFLKLVLVTK